MRLKSELYDFYSSREHATNVGIMFRSADNALQPTGASPLAIMAGRPRSWYRALMCGGRRAGAAGSRARSMLQRRCW